MSVTVSLAQVNRFTLGRHALLARENLDAVTLISRICGLQAQVASGPSLALWARLSGFQVTDLERALYEARSLVRGWFMRGTLHVVPTAELPIYIGAVAVQPASDPRLSYLRRKGIAPEGLPWERWRAAVRAALRAGPLSRAELIEAVGGEAPPAGLGWPNILYALCKQGYILHARPTGKWHHYGRVRFAWRASWAGLPDGEILPQDEARGQLLLRYLGAFGPATVHDFAYWAGLKVGQARAALEQVQAQVGEVRLEGDRRALWLRAEDLPRLLETDPATPAPPRLLPRFDTVLLGHRDKERVLDPGWQQVVFRAQGEVASTILVDGRVAGVYKYRLPKGRLGEVSLAPFRELAVEAIAGLEGEVERLGSFCECVERWPVKI